MNKFDLSLAKYIQEYAPLPLEAVEAHFDKTRSTISRSIAKINRTIDKRDYISVEKQMISTRFSFHGYTKLLNNLTLEHYRSSADERIKALLVEMAFNDVVNKKQFYSLFSVSLTTLKNDRKPFIAALQTASLGYQPVAKKGIRLLGSEGRIRILATKALLNIVELDKDNQIIEHLSISPVNRLIAQHFLQRHQQQIAKAVKLYFQLEQRYGFKLSYNSKKFLIIYFALSLRRMALAIDRRFDNFTTLNEQDFSLFDDRQENDLANQVISSLTSHNKFNCCDGKLMPLVEDFIAAVCAGVKTHIYSRDALFADAYALIHGSLIQARLGITFPDKKLTGVKHEHQLVYEIVERDIADLEQAIGITLNETHLATLTMVIKRYIELNKSIDRRRTRIYLISNSSYNKLGYFIEKLKTHFHVEIMGIVNSNEVIHIPDDRYDILITFTNKISRYLTFRGKSSVKLDHRFKESDIQTLKRLGLSRAARKIPADTFIQHIERLPARELKHFLVTHFQEHFI
jgi:hypothetical protein